MCVQAHALRKQGGLSINAGPRSLSPPFAKLSKAHLETAFAPAQTGVTGESTMKCMHAMHMAVQFSHCRGDLDPTRQHGKLHVAR